MVLGSGNVKHMKREAWSELAIKFRRTLRWERLNLRSQQQQHKVQKEKKRKEGVHAWSSRKDKDLYERLC